MHVEVQQWYYLTYIYGNKGMSSKVNVTTQLEFELAYYDVADQYVNHYTTGTPPAVFCFCFLFFSFLLVCKETQ